MGPAAGAPAAGLEGPGRAGERDGGGKNAGKRKELRKREETACACVEGIIRRRRSEAREMKNL